MSRNFAIGTRHLDSAGRLWAEKAGLSYSSVDTVADRWTDFARFCKYEKKVGRMERVTYEIVREYAKELIKRDLSASTIQNRLSAINTVMRVATNEKWKSLSPRELGAPARSYVRMQAPRCLDVDLKASLEGRANDREEALAGLAREFGLREAEAAKLDAKSALREALSKGEIHVTYGTKGGRPRIVPITDISRQIPALERAAAVQGKSGSMIPIGVSYKAFRPVIDHTRAAVGSVTGGQGLHALRAGYACTRYRDITGAPAPVVAGKRLVSKSLDYEARLQIAKELGHNRVDVTASYLGSAK